jgi:hypothetical protein
LGDTRGKLFLHLYIGKKSLKGNGWPISMKLRTNIPYITGIQVYSNEGPSSLQTGIITKVQK